MDCLSAALYRNIDNLVDVQVGLAGGRRTNAIGFVRVPRVQCRAVDVGEDRNGRNPHLLACAQHTDGYFSSVGDQYLLEHYILLERDVAVLAGRIGIALILQHLESPDDLGACFFRHDDFVDVSALRCLIG